MIPREGSRTPETIDMGEAIRYPVAEDGWLAKAGILALISVVPILNYAAVGYEVEIARRVAAGAKPLLTPWADLGAHFRRGLSLAVARYIYFIPVLVLMGLALVAAGAALFTIDTSYEAWSWVPGLACGGSFLLGTLLAFVASAVSPAVTVRYCEVGTFASCFDFPGIWRTFRLHPGPHLAVFAWTLALGLALGLLVGPASVFLGLIPCIGVLGYPLLFAAMFSITVLVMAHLEGQLLHVVSP